MWKHLLSSPSSSAGDSFGTSVQMEEQDDKASVLAVSVQREETITLIDFMNQGSPLSCSSVKYLKMLPVQRSPLVSVSDGITENLQINLWGI